MSTLISILGKSTADAQTGYRTTNYRFDEDFARSVPFFGMALLEYIKPEKLILAGTSGSMWDVFFDHQQVGDESLLSLIDAVANGCVTQAMLTAHEGRLTDKLGIPVKCLLIPYAKTQEEQVAILNDLASVVNPGETITLDVTHGFRHLPMLALVAARYLTHVRNVQVDEVYYGAWEMTPAGSQDSPVLRLKAMLQMLDWMEALASYDHSGDYGVFSTLLKADGMDAKAAELLSQAAYFERSSNPVQAKQALSTVLENTQKHQGPLGRLFSDALTERISWFKKGNRANWELNLADRYLAQNDHLRAIIYLYESFVSHAVNQYGGDLNDFDSRKLAYDKARQDKPQVKTLEYLRNSMAHGVRPRNDNEKRLLKDQAVLEKELIRLRSILFS